MASHTNTQKRRVGDSSRHFFDRSFFIILIEEKNPPIFTNSSSWTPTTNLSTIIQELLIKMYRFSCLESGGSYVLRIILVSSVFDCLRDLTIACNNTTIKESSKLFVLLFIDMMQSYCPHHKSKIAQICRSDLMYIKLIAFAI